MDTSRRRTARLITATALAVGVLAAPAAAAEVQPLKPCYVSAGEEPTSREAIRVRGRDFTPLAPVDITVDGEVTSGTADTVGDVIADVPAPYEPDRERRVTVTVVERGNPANAVTLETRVTALSVTVRPGEAKPSRRVRFRGRGFTADRPVFAHYILGDKERKTVRLAKRTRGACGRFSVRRRQIPVRNPSTGEWTVQIDQRRGYRADPGTNWVRLLIRVRRVFREP